VRSELGQPLACDAQPQGATLPAFCRAETHIPVRNCRNTWSFIHLLRWDSHLLYGASLFEFLGSFFVARVSQMQCESKLLLKCTMSWTDERCRAPLVKNPQIQSATLHNPLPLYLHTYIWPFLAIWPAFFAIYLSEERYNTYIAGSEWTFVWAGSIITAQSLAWLTTQWNVNLATLFTSVTARDVRSAKLIKVIPVTNAGSAEICPLLRDSVGNISGRL